MYYIIRLLPSIGIFFWGTTILLSCNHPHATRIDELVTYDLEEDIHQRNDHGATALHNSAKIGDAAIVHTLLNRGENVNHRDSDGATALHYATLYGLVVFVLFLFFLLFVFFLCRFV